MVGSRTFSPGDMVATNCKGFDPEAKWEFVSLVNPAPGLPLHAELKRFTHIRAVVPLSSLTSAAPNTVTADAVVEWLKENQTEDVAEKFLERFGE